MVGPGQVAQGALFYEFSIEDHGPGANLPRRIDRFVDLSDIRCFLAPFYSTTVRPSIDPELMIRMVFVGCCFGIRSERRLCDEVHLILAYRRFCRLDLASLQRALAALGTTPVDRSRVCTRAPDAPPDPADAFLM